jgi:hypothetical protein
MREGVRLIKIAAGFIRGGNWNNGANDGAFTLNLNNAPSNSNTNIGFRCSRYALPAHAGGQNESSTEPSQRSHRSILTHSFSRADFVRQCGKISGPYLRFVVVIPQHGTNVQGGVSGLFAKS